MSLAKKSGSCGSGSTRVLRLPELVLVPAPASPSGSSTAPSPALGCPTHTPLLSPSPLLGATRPGPYRLLNRHQHRSTLPRLVCGVAQVGSGFLLACGGVLSIVLEAPLAWVGGGVWAGVLLLGAGLVALGGALRAAPCGQAALVLSQLLAGTLALSASSLALVFAGAGLARAKDSSSDSVQQVKALHAALVALAILGCSSSLGSLALCLRDACTSPESEAVKSRRRKRLAMLRSRHRLLLAHALRSSKSAWGPRPLECPDPLTAVQKEAVSTSNKKKKAKDFPSAPAENSKAKEKPKEVTEEDVAKTYTGLDRELAEQFIVSSMGGHVPRELPYDDF